MKFLRHVLLLLATMSLALACTDEVDYLEDLLKKDNADKGDVLQVTGVTFSDDYKHFSVDTRLKGSIGHHSLSDSAEVKITAMEYDHLGNPLFAVSQPHLDRVVSEGAAQIVSANLKMLVLVDLTLSQSMVDKEREAVKEMATLFTNDNLYVSFITRKHEDNSVMIPSEYVLDNYFKSVHTDEKALYYTISKGMNILSDENGIFSDVTERVLMVLSDGKLFSDNYFNAESNYFAIKQDILTKSCRTENSQLMYYVDIKDQDDENPDDAESFLTTVCRNTGGRTFDNFNWIAIENDIFSRLNINYTDYRFEFTNPDKKVYSGFTKVLKIKCCHGEDVIASCSTNIMEGTYFSPIVVNPDSNKYMILRGLVFSLSIIFIVLLILQFLVPYLHYLLFRRKYVIAYTDENTVVEGNLVGDSCYYCKAPFKEGEMIVAKCKHAMHESCWKENGYHCPEYGRNCKHGSHYYNESDLLDFRNSPFYTKWIFVAVASALLTWIIYMLSYDSLDYGILADYAYKDANRLQNNSFLTPLFGYLVAAFACMGFSLITIKRRSIGKRLLEAFIRSQIAALFSYFVFAVAAFAIISVVSENNFIVLDSIPWIFSGLGIAICSTYHTSYYVRIKSFLIIMTVCFVAEIFWSFLSIRTSMVYSPYILVLFLLFCVGLAIGLARKEPFSERYFLRTSGAVKEMDIALYKWFSNSPDAVVSIGRSVDCDIEMAWDSSPEVGPKSVEIRQESDSLYLYVLDGSVRCGRRSVGEGERARLYHGRKFQIGNTEFTYLERDI